MAVISNYVFTNLISMYGYTPNLFIDDYNTLYATFANNYQGSNFLTLYSSPDNGVTWVEDSVPVSETYTFDSPKIIVSNDIYYLFSNVKENIVTKKSIVLIKKYTNITDDDGNITAEDFWEDDYKKVIFDTNYNCRITDCKLSENKYYIYITYDKELMSGVYEARFAVYSILDEKIKIDISIMSDSAINNHNAKIVEIDQETVGFSYETQYISEYGNKTYQIAYRQYSLSAGAWTNTLQVSNDLKHNNYHQSVVKDSGDTIYIVWLNTQNVNYKGSIKYFATNTIKLATISNNTVDTIEDITTEAQENEYPYILCDLNDNLYILYNKDNKVQYLRQKYDKWVSISELEDNTWKMLMGLCFDSNLYTIIEQDDGYNYICRIDTTLAENFEPVRDLQIYDVNNEEIGLAWTSARNANYIEVQQKLSNIVLWDYTLANTTTPINKDTNTVQVVGLEDKTYYAFKLEYTTTDGNIHTQYFPEKYVDHTTNENFKFDWTVNLNTKKQVLYVAKEKWEYVKDVPVTANNTSFGINSNGNCYRLYIKGGYAEGYSNTVSPLTIDLKDENYVLSWTPFRTASKVELQQSIDKDIYYKAVDTNISTKDSQFTISKLNHVIYHYRIAYTINDKVNYTNIVTLTNNLQLLEVGYNYINISWITVDKDEQVQLQISTDKGKTWQNKTFHKDSTTNITKVSKLQYATDYKIRLYFPDRYTGQYSNIITFKTEKHPITNLIVDCNSKDTINFQFDMGSSVSDAELELYDIYDGSKKKYKLSTLTSNLTKTNPSDPDTCYLNKTTHRIKGKISGLKKGTYYSVFVTALDAYYGNSKVSDIVNTLGDGITSLSFTNLKAHEVTLNIGTLDRINNTNASDFIIIRYTKDNIEYEEIKTNITFPYKLEGLEQNTVYHIQIQCSYGNNYGESNIITIKTLADSFNPIIGKRLNDECCFTYSKPNKLFYIFDKGKLYTYNKDTKVQKLLVDYKIQANHIYGDIDVDKNGKVHLVFTYGKGIYYATNCRTLNDDETITEHKLTDIITVDTNNLVNEYLYPDIAIDMNNNYLYIVWQADYGTYSDICYMQYRNAEPSQDNVMNLITNKTSYHNLPKVVLQENGSWSVFCIDNTGILKCAMIDIDNDYTSVTYLQPSVNIQTVKLENPYLNDYNNFDVWADVAGGYRLLYDSIDSDGYRTSTYALLNFDKQEPLTVENIFNDGLHDVKIYAGQELTLIGRNTKDIYISKYQNDEMNQGFSDLAQLTIQTDDFKPLTTYYDEENIYILTRNAGMWKIDNISQADIVDTDISTGGILMSTPIEYQANDQQFVAIMWTVGDSNNYPQVYIKVNNDVKNITPTDEFGYPDNQVFVINKIEEMNLADSSISNIIKNNTKYVLKVTYNDTKSIILDITNMLYYNWDSNEMYNKLSNMS